MADSDDKDSGQHFMLDHLIQKMAAGISPQGQYSQFGFVNPPDMIWSDKENNCMPPLFDPRQNVGYNIELGTPRESHVVNNESLYFSPINCVTTPGAFLDNIFPCDPGIEKTTQCFNGMTRDASHPMQESFMNIPVFSDIQKPCQCLDSKETIEPVIPQSEPSVFEIGELNVSGNMAVESDYQSRASSSSTPEVKPSYSDIVSKVCSSRSASTETQQSSSVPSPTITRQVKHGSSSKPKDKFGMNKPFGRLKRQSSGWSTERSFESPRLNQRKSVTSQKKSDFNVEIKRRNSVDSAFNYGLENISLDDPSPKVKNSLEVTKKNIGESDAVNNQDLKYPDAPLNNENMASALQAKTSLSKRPLNINNNLNSSKNGGRASPASSDGSSGPILKSCNQDEWNTINKNKFVKVDSGVKLGEPVARKSSDSKPRTSKSSGLLNSSVNSSGKSDKRSKELLNKKKRRKCSESYPYFENLIKTAMVYVSTWANLALVFFTWLFQLICDVIFMSSKLLLHLMMVCFARVKDFVLKVSGVLSYYLKSWLSNVWPFNTISSKKSTGLTENIALPMTGDEALKRLLACRGEDPYGILGVTADCSDDDIKKFYKRQAILVHPDKNRQPGAEEAFKVLGHSFDLIGEPTKRREYDDTTVKEKEMSAAMREFSELIKELHRKMEEAANTICCTNCNGKHKRLKTDRPCFCARYCKKCEIRHAAREGDLWAESSMFGFLWHYYSCMDGAVYDITQWAICQSDRLKHLEANTHIVQYRIVTGNGNNTSGRWGGRRSKYDIPSEADLEEFLNNIYQQTMPGSGKASDRASKQPSASKRKPKKKRN